MLCASSHCLSVYGHIIVGRTYSNCATKDMEEHGDGDLGTDGAGIFHPRPYTNKNDNGSSESLPPEVWAVVMECKCKLCCVVYIIIYDDLFFICERI